MQWIDDILQMFEVYVLVGCSSAHGGYCWNWKGRLSILQRQQMNGISVIFLEYPLNEFKSFL